MNVNVNGVASAPQLAQRTACGPMPSRRVCGHSAPQPGQTAAQYGSPLKRPSIGRSGRACSPATTGSAERSARASSGRAAASDAIASATVAPSGRSRESLGAGATRASPVPSRTRTWIITLPEGQSDATPRAASRPPGGAPVGARVRLA